MATAGPTAFCTPNDIRVGAVSGAVVPSAQVSFARIPGELPEENVVALSDISTTGLAGAERAAVRLGDAVVIIAQRPDWFSFSVEAKLMRASAVIDIDDDTRFAKCVARGRERHALLQVCGSTAAGSGLSFATGAPQTQQKSECARDPE